MVQDALLAVPRRSAGPCVMPGPGTWCASERGAYRTRTNITIVQSGRPGRPITFRGYRSRPLIAYTGGREHGGGVLQTTVCRPWCASHDLLIEHLRIYGKDLMEAGVFEQMGARDVAVVDCVITNTGATGIALNGIDHAFVADNLIYHTGYALGWSSGISLWYGEYGGANAASDDASGFHNYIVGNIISGSYDNSFHHSDGHGIIVDGARGFDSAGADHQHRVRERRGREVIVARYRWRRLNTSTTPVTPTALTGESVLDTRPTSWLSRPPSSTSSTTSHTVRRRGAGVHVQQHQQLDPVGPGNMGYRGRNRPECRQRVIDNRHLYRYANPRFVRLPPVPSGPRPWARAVPPWQLGRAFRLRGRSPAIAAGLGSDASERGMTRQCSERACGLIGPPLANVSAFCCGRRVLTP